MYKRMRRSSLPTSTIWYGLIHSYKRLDGYAYNNYKLSYDRTEQKSVNCTAYWYQKWTRQQFDSVLLLQTIANFLSLCYFSFLGHGTGRGATNTGPDEVGACERETNMANSD